MLLLAPIGAQAVEPLVLTAEVLVLHAEAVVLHAEVLVLYAEAMVLQLNITNGYLFVFFEKLRTIGSTYRIKINKFILFCARFFVTLQDLSHY